MRQAYRFRALVFVSLYLLGFWAPWEGLHGGHGTLWLAASALCARSGWISLAAATFTVTVTAFCCLLLGAILRVWGTAYIGPSIMIGTAMHGDAVLDAGPYRFVRNPLYLGSWLVGLGVSILMPPSGAAFFMLAFSIFALSLIFAEERFLLSRQQDAYQDYRNRVPRLLPRIFTGDASSPLRPRWLRALLAETYPIGFTLCFAVFAWRYNARILIQCLLICYGLSLVMRAFTKPE